MSETGEEFRTLVVACMRCGGTFSMRDKQETVWVAYGVWDGQHKHDESVRPEEGGDE